MIPAPSQELELKREARGVLDQSEDPEATFAQAVESGKRVLLHFTAAWCNACVPLSREVIRNPELQELLSRYEVVEIDADRFEHWSLKHHYKIDVYPTLIVAEPDSRYVGRLEGYSGQEKTLAWLEQGTEMEAFEDLQRRLSKVEMRSAAP